MVFNIPTPLKDIEEAEPLDRPTAPLRGPQPRPRNIIFNVANQAVVNANTNTAINTNVQTISRTSKVCASVIFGVAVILIAAAVYMILFLKDLVSTAIMLIAVACVLMMLVACGLWCLNLCCCKKFCSWFSKKREPRPSETTPLLPPTEQPENYQTAPNTPNLQRVALQAQDLFLEQEAPTVAQAEPETPALAKEAPTVACVETSTLQQLGKETPNLDQPVLETPALQQPAKEPLALAQPDLETPALPQPAKEPSTLDQPDLETSALQYVAKEKSTLPLSDLKTPAQQKSDNESSTEI